MIMMNTTTIRVRRSSSSIKDDLKRAGFVQINTISLCYRDMMVITYEFLGNDIIIVDKESAGDIIAVLKHLDMYISHNDSVNAANGMLLDAERSKCLLVGRV